MMRWVCGVLALLAVGCGDDGTGSVPDSAPEPADAPPDAPLSQLDRIDLYIAAWSEPDEQTRRAMLESAWTDDGVYEDPTATANGREELVALMGGFQVDFPGAHFERTTAVQLVPGDHLRFGWKLVDSTGTDALTGQDLGEVTPDDRLQRITGFFGAVPAPDGAIDAASQARLDAWNEPDGTARDALMPVGWEDGAVFVDGDQGTIHEGTAAISAAIGGFHQSLPGASMVLTSDVDAYGGHWRCNWELRDSGGTVVLAGQLQGHRAGDGRSTFEISWPGVDPAQ